MTNDPHGIEPDDATRALDEDPSMEHLFGQLNELLGGGSKTDADGWGGINDVGKAMQKQRAESLAAMKREANVFRDTFLTPAGLKCLAIMKEMTIDAAPYPSESMLPIDAITPLIIAHDAQCRFVRAIKQAIDFAENREATA